MWHYFLSPHYVYFSNSVFKHLCHLYTKHAVNLDSCPQMMDNFCGNVQIICLGGQLPSLAQLLDKLFQEDDVQSVQGPPEQREVEPVSHFTSGMDSLCHYTFC